MLERAIRMGLFEGRSMTAGACRMEGHLYWSELSRWAIGTPEASADHAGVGARSPDRKVNVGRTAVLLVESVECRILIPVRWGAGGGSAWAGGGAGRDRRRARPAVRGGTGCGPGLSPRLLPGGRGDPVRRLGRRRIPLLSGADADAASWFQDVQLSVGRRRRHPGRPRRRTTRRRARPPRSPLWRGRPRRSSCAGTPASNCSYPDWASGCSRSRCD